VTGISTHVLDTAAGAPATGVPVSLALLRDGAWASVGSGVTDADGRLGDLQAVEPGTYRIRFDTAGYFADRGVRGFYPEVSVVFDVVDAGEHHHVPLLLSPFGYSTYRGT
jgi:5-hydroxyisourate hydrolase